MEGYFGVWDNSKRNCTLPPNEESAQNRVKLLCVSKRTTLNIVSFGALGTRHYARAHDQTVSDDYYTSMNRVEQRLELAGLPEETKETVTENERTQILALTRQLAQPELTAEIRLQIAKQIRLVLVGETAVMDAST